MAEKKKKKERIVRKMFIEVEPHVHHAFKIACAIEGRSMTDVLVSTMKSLSEVYGILDESKKEQEQIVEAETFTGDLLNG